MNKKRRNPLATFAQGVSDAVAAIALAPLFFITSFFDG